MKKNRWRRAAAAAIALLMVFGCAAFAAEAPLYGQRHVVPDYARKNEAFAKRYYDGCGRALDGTAGAPDLCIPGLSEEDNMVPQGIAYYPEKDQMLISAYSKGEAGSVIFALDMTDGHLAAEYRIVRRSGNPAAAHFGGIAVSEHNLYLADYDSTISYVPLSALNAADGASAEVTLGGTADCAAYLNGANTSYIGCGSGMLWTGNYYDSLDEGYRKKAAADCASVIVCFTLTGDDSESEWAGLTAPDGNSCAAPAHTLRVPATVEHVQGAYLQGDVAWLSVSAGRSNPAWLYRAPVDYEAGRILSRMRRTEALPSAEDLELKDGVLYTLAENGAWHFNGGDGGAPAMRPFDTVWSVDLTALENALENPLQNLLGRLVRWFAYLSALLKTVC